VIEKLGTQAGKGKLNPRWVCSLQGIPAYWTDLYLTTETPSVIVDLTERDNYEICYKILCLLSKEVGTQTLQWETGRFFYFYAEEILRQDMLLQGQAERGSGKECIAQEGKQVSWEELREMWNKEGIGNPSQGQKHQEQQQGKPADPVCEVPHKMALGKWKDYAQKFKANLFSLWENMPYSCWPMHSTLSKTKEIWESAADEETYKWYLGTCQRYIRWQESHKKSPIRVDELRLLGNGVVPQCAELAFRTLIGKFTLRSK
jgi:hypothetical protein